jgi:hypothetical protein
LAEDEPGFRQGVIDRIAITEAAYEAIARTLALGTVAVRAAAQREPGRAPDLA